MSKLLLDACMKLMLMHAPPSQQLRPLLLFVLQKILTHSNAKEGKMTSLLLLCSLFLPVLSSVEKRSPLDLGSYGSRDRWTAKSDKSYSYSDQNKNQSWDVFKGNPTEYTIGGVLSGAPGVEFYFTQVLSVSLL